MKQCAAMVKMMLLLAVLLLLNLVQANPVRAALYTIYPHADVSVNSQHPDTNYNTEPDLYVYYYPDYLGSPLTERTYLKFDLTGIPANYIITSAKLYLYVIINDGHPFPNADLYHVGDDWSKFGITWNSQPPTGEYLASQGFMFWGQYYAWNLFESGLWRPAQDLANSKLSLLLKLNGEGELASYAGYTFSSSESGTFGPYLEVTAIPAPNSANILLLTE